MHQWTRRDFLAASAGTAASLTLAGLAARALANPNQEGPKVEYRQFGKTDMKVSALGFGGAEIGFEQTDQELVDRLLNSALDAGLNVVDTAECYMGSEESIGRAISNRRDEYYLFTKVGHMHGYAGGGDWSAASIAESIDRSLKRLRTDRVDLVQLHSCKADVIAKGEAIEALEKARTQGKTRYIGYSGDSTDAVAAIKTDRFDTLQTSVSIADQQSIDLLLPLARERNMGVIAKRPIANAAWRYKEKPENGYHTTYWERFQKLDYPFLKGDMSEAVGIALRFTLSQPGVHTAIVGTSKPERWKQNAALIEPGPLPKEQIEAIRKRWREIATAEWVGQV